MEKKLDGNYTRMPRAILNKSWRPPPTKQELYGHLPPISKTIQVRRTRHAGHCRRSRDKIISDVLLWTSLQGRVKAGRPARTYIQQLCADTGCSLEDQPEATAIEKGGGRRSGRSVVTARYDDNVDDEDVSLWTCVSKFIKIDVNQKTQTEYVSIIDELANYLITNCKLCICSIK